MNGAGLFFLLLLLLVILPACGWIGYTRWRAHRNGLPPPPLSAYNPFKRFSSSSGNYGSRSGGGASGITNWVQDKFSNIKNSRFAGSSGGGGGGYSGGGGLGAGGRSGTAGHAFGPLDPDGAWDDRVGNEADAYGPVGGDYEEQELGIHAPMNAAGGYGENRTAMPPYGQGDVNRGKSRTRDMDTSYHGGRDLDRRYDEEMGVADDPFGDEAELGSSLRGVSPRPVEMEGHGVARGAGRLGVKGDSPTERKSMFREGV